MCSVVSAIIGHRPARLMNILVLRADFMRNNVQPENCAKQPIQPKCLLSIWPLTKMDGILSNPHTAYRVFIFIVRCLFAVYDIFHFDLTRNSIARDVRRQMCVTFTWFLQPDHLLRDIQTVALVRNPNPFYHIHSHLNGNISLRGQFGLPYIQNTRKKEKKMRAQQTACN